jgi:hypothetical protein
MFGFFNKDKFYPFLRKNPFKIRKIRKLRDKIVAKRALILDIFFIVKKIYELEDKDTPLSLIK